jgi:hypothetical protein
MPVVCFEQNTLHGIDILSSAEPSLVHDTSSKVSFVIPSLPIQYSFAVGVCT